MYKRIDIFSLFSMGNPAIFSLIDKAISDYSMVEAGDKILIAASGGKDSTVMAEYFYNRKKRKSCNFEVKAFHVATSISPSFPHSLKEKFEELRGKVTLRKMKKKGQIKLPFLWNSLMSI